jgi:hypothetical protein
LALFLLVNGLYFVTIHFNQTRTYETALHLQFRNPYQSVVRRLAGQRLMGATEAERGAYEAAFDARNHALSKSLLILIVPMSAFTLACLYRRQRRYFGEHLVTALHYVALLIVVNMALGIFFGGSMIGSVFRLVGASPPLLLFEVLEPMAWVWLVSSLSLKNAYGDTWQRAVIYGLLWSLLYIPLLIGYRFLLFLLTFYSVA